MNMKIQEMVAHLFRNCAETQEVQAAKEEITRNCQEHYQDLLASGMTEQDAIRAVGESLLGMEELAASYPQKGQEPDPFEKQSAPAGNQQADPFVKQPAPHGPLDFPAEAVRSMELQLLSHDVTVEPSQDGFYNLICENGVPEKLDISCENGVLKISFTDTVKRMMKDGLAEMTEGAGNIHDLEDVGGFLRKLGSWLGGGVKRSLENANDDSPITIQVPGHVQPDMKLTTTGGDVNINRVSFGKLTVTSVSGDVELSRVTAFGPSVIRTTSGDINGEISASERLEITSISGDVTVVGGCNGDMVVHTTSGDLNATPVCRKLELHSVSGDVEGDIRAFIPGGVTVHTVSGAVDLTVVPEVPVTLKTSTTSGSINCNHANSFPGGMMVQISTVSGQISVE